MIGDPLKNKIYKSDYVGGASIINTAVPKF